MLLPSGYLPTSARLRCCRTCGQWASGASCCTPSSAFGTRSIRTTLLRENPQRTPIDYDRASSCARALRGQGAAVCSCPINPGVATSPEPYPRTRRTLLFLSSSTMKLLSVFLCFVVGASAAAIPAASLSGSATRTGSAVASGQCSTSEASKIEGSR
jgi:hypothetical protein